MKKIIFQTVLLTLLCISPGIATPALAATTYPYSPTEVLTNFETTYKSQYDVINADLADSIKAAHAWSIDAALQKFEISWADGTESGYTFNFIDASGDKAKALLFYPSFESGFKNMEIDRTPDMKYGIYSVPLRLRDLVPAMKADKKLLPLLEQLIDDDRNVSINFTLLKNSSGTLVWRVYFTSSRDANGTQAKQDYLVTVDAVKTASPVFSVLKLK